MISNMERCSLHSDILSSSLCNEGQPAFVISDSHLQPFQLPALHCFNHQTSLQILGTRYCKISNFLSHLDHKPETCRSSTHNWYLRRHILHLSDTNIDQGLELHNNSLVESTIVFHSISDSLLRQAAKSSAEIVQLVRVVKVHTSPTMVILVKILYDIWIPNLLGHLRTFKVTIKVTTSYCDF
jgi:hypothetical protein